jgi:hypothetical protein
MRCDKMSPFMCNFLYVLVIRGLKSMGLAKPPKYECGQLQICPVPIPTNHGLSILRDTHTFPISQSKLEAALFGASFNLNDCSRFGYVTKDGIK